jgi:excisionase family DNA binding protein
MKNRRIAVENERDVSIRPVDNSAPDCLLRAADLQELLGLSRAKIYRLMQENVLPTVRIGGSIRVPQRALAHWIEQNTRISAARAGCAALPTDSVRNEGL